VNETDAIMSKQFFYAKLRFTPKATCATATPYPREVIVEVPKDLAERKESEINDEVLRKVFALDLARSAALRTFPTAEQYIELYEQGPPTWLDERVTVMNERPCDYTENGVRAWRID
jgi:hypothetical protein